MSERSDSKPSSVLVHSRDLTTTSSDGVILRGRSWGVPTPRATLLIAHGLGEHGGSYEPFAGEFVANLEMEVFCFDFRGSGRSPGKRGFVGSYDELTDDLVAAHNWVLRESPNVPHFLMGHSNGGLVAIRALLDRRLTASGLILSNPSLRLKARVPGWKRVLGEILLRIAPSLTLSTGLDNAQLTSDPAVIDRIDQDGLRHGRISAPLFFGMLDAGPEALVRASEIVLPCLVLIGEDDSIADPESGRSFFERLASPDKTLRSYSGMRHEPLNELGRQEVVSDIMKWISDRLSLDDDLTSDASRGARPDRAFLGRSRDAPSPDPGPGAGPPSA